MATLEFFFDCSSPWTYYAFHNIQRLAQKHNAKIDWKPFLVGGVFNTINPSVYASRDNPVPAKESYMVKSMQDWARLTGPDLIFPPSVFPVNSVKVMRGCLVADQEGKLPQFARAAFEAYWRDDRDISQDDVIRDISMAGGIDGDHMLQAITAQPIKDQLRANTDE